MARTIRLWCGVLLCVASVRIAVGQQIAVGPTVAISTDAPSDPHGESFLAINPRNPKNLIAASCRINKDGAGTSAYVSHDGGQTWSRVKLPPTADKVGTGWDVITYFDAGGTAYYAANDRYGLWITRSSDEGRTWSEATLLPGIEGFDRQQMGFDRTGRFAGRIYAGATGESVGLDGKSHGVLAVSFSSDGAKTFSQPRLMTGLANETIGPMLNIIVTPEGTVVLPFTTMMEQQENPFPSLWDATDWGKKASIEMVEPLRVATSGDGGASYSVSQPVMRNRSLVDPTSGFEFDKVQGNGFAAIDLSNGPYRGRIYLVWIEHSEDDHKVRVVHSDEGKTWSKPVTVNDNAGSSKDANPTIAVSNRGVVGVTWNDRRNHNDECYDLYFSASLDGGETFLPNVTTRRKPTCSLAPGNWLPRADISAYPKTEAGLSVEGQGLNVLMISTRFPGGGDTQGLEADGDGVFHAAWIDGSSGVMQLADTTFSVKGEAEKTLASEHDVSTQVKLISKECAFDWKAHTFTCAMHLVNKSPLPVSGPFTVELQNMRVNLKGFRVGNADNARAAEGARWTFVGSQLMPGGETDKRTFEWHFTEIPEKPEYPFMMFKVVSSAKEAPARASLMERGHSAANGR
jgi:hypothetical protein